MHTMRSFRIFCNRATAPPTHRYFINDVELSGSDFDLILGLEHLPRLHPAPPPRVDYQTNQQASQ